MTSFLAPSSEIPKQHRKEEISSVKVNIYSDDTNNIEDCIKEIELVLEQAYTNYTLSDYKDLVKDLTKDEVST